MHNDIKIPRHRVSAQRTDLNSFVVGSIVKGMDWKSDALVVPIAPPMMLTLLKSSLDHA